MITRQERSAIEDAFLDAEGDLPVPNNWSDGCEAVFRVVTLCGRRCKVRYNIIEGRWDKIIIGHKVDSGWAAYGDTQADTECIYLD